ncbi:biotin transporter BioY [Thermococcus argininiproducens]|uniref:Biotin transporter BioY n=1 Tax=Thermococcus argininiproducens TaxID=2866384 RepID=A0A9E7SCD7_9EURY|nr:biotin transporter BioY [Thermococcus argininiproducens]USG99695.1 biotin transporter BioY [Thermococcus argininiproducens]
MRAKDIAYPSLFAALTAVGAQIAIPLGTVPITLQVLFVLLSGFILGSRLGFLSQLIYLLMGSLGLPVFANLSGGFAYIYGPTGGYLIAFPLAAFLVGFLSERQETFLNYTLAMLLGILVIYLLGWFRLGIFMGGDFRKAFIVGVAPFVIIDLIKGGIATIVAKRVKQAVTI